MSFRFCGELSLLNNYLADTLKYTRTYTNIPVNPNQTCWNLPGGPLHQLRCEHQNLQVAHHLTFDLTTRSLYILHMYIFYSARKIFGIFIRNSTLWNSFKSLYIQPIDESADKVYNIYSWCKPSLMCPLVFSVLFLSLVLELSIRWRRKKKKHLLTSKCIIGEQEGKEII